MASPAAILREAHRLRRQASDLQAEIERGPRLLKGQKSRVEQRQEALKEAQEAIKKLKVTSLEKESGFKTALQQIAKYEKQLQTAATKKEMDALNTEIANARKLHQRLEEEAFEALADAEERTAKIPDLDKAVQQAKQELAQFEKDYEARQANLAGQLAQSQASLAEVEQSLDDETRPKYQRIVAQRGDDALSSVRERTCTACYTSITAQNYNDLVVGLYIPCKSCGRILYLGE